MFPIGLTCRNQIFSASATLSEILKQSGIKEYKSKKNKKSGAIKKKTKYYYEKYMKNGYETTLDRIQKHKNPPKNILSPIEKESSPTGVLHTEKKESKKSVISKENEREEEAIYVSLDFIEDCQKYKKKLTSAGDNGVNSYSKSIERYRNLYPNQGKGYQTSEGRISSKSSIRLEIKLCKNNSLNDQPLKTEDILPKQSERLLREKEIKRPIEKRFSEAVLCQKPVFVKKSSEEISKIDKKYLESLISITKRTQCKKYPSHADRHDIRIEIIEKSESNFERKKKHFHQGVSKKLKRDTNQIEYLENLQETNQSKNVTKFSHESENLPTFDGDLTKTDQQLKPTRTDPPLTTSTGKNATHPKLTLNEIHKKRTSRMKQLKKDAEEFGETFNPIEVRNSDVIQELWKKQSENSLTSGSSTNNGPENEIKNLDSYKYLSKLVQEEIQNILNKSGKKIERGTEKSKSSAETQKKSNEISGKLPTSLQDNSSEIPIFRSETKTPAHKKTQKNPQYPKLLVDDIPKEANCNFLEKNAKEGPKLPSQVIENWSILNRLEQAFLALGTPTFQNPKKKIETPSKTPGAIKEATERPQTAKTNTRKNPKTKNVSVKKDIKECPNPGSLQTKNNLWISGKTPPSSRNKNTQNEKTTALNEKPKENDLKNDSKPQQLEVNCLKVSKNNENKIKCKKRKKTSIEPEENLPGENTKQKNDQINHAKEQAVPASNKPATEKNSEINLERKSTFSVVKLASNTTNLQPRISKGCNKSDGDIKICYSKTNNKENQLPSEPTVMGQPKLSKSNGYEEGIKTISPIIHKRLTKTYLKKESSPERENPKNSEEKNALKENLAKPRVAHVKKSERTEELRPCSAGKKEMYNKTITNSTTQQKFISSSPSNGKERVVKKRSILSVHANQICNEPAIMLQKIHEKDGADMYAFYPNSKNQEYIRNVNASQITVIITNSNTSVTSTTTYTNDFHPKCLSESGSVIAVARPQEISDVPSSWCSDTMFSSVTECRTQPSEPIIEKVEVKKESWERDLSQYHQIVREIMSQYKRIDGWLKQSEKVNNTFSSNEGVRNSINAEAESQLISLKEYRKKIISEYEALPNFEYKRKILENAGGNLYFEDPKRNLAVVKDTETFEDEDVKDRHPKMKKILDSQLYVEPENLSQVEQKEKFKQKNSSLQNMVMSENGKIFENQRLRSFSTKAIPLQHSHVTLCSSQLTSSKDNLTSFSGLDCFMHSETETETS